MNKIEYLEASILLLLIGYLVYWADSQSLFPWRLLRNHMPDGLWAASFIACLCFIWHDHKFFLYFWSFIAITSMIAFELFQFHGIVNGTGDILDAIVYLVFSLFVMAISHKKTKITSI